MRRLLAAVALALVAGTGASTAARAEASTSAERGVVTACTANETRVALVSFVRASTQATLGG